MLKKNIINSLNQILLIILLSLTFKNSYQMEEEEQKKQDILKLENNISFNDLKNLMNGKIFAWSKKNKERKNLDKKELMTMRDTHAQSLINRLIGGTLISITAGSCLGILASKYNLLKCDTNNGKKLFGCIIGITSSSIIYQPFNYFITKSIKKKTEEETIKNSFFFKIDNEELIQELNKKPESTEMKNFEELIDIIINCYKKLHKDKISNFIIKGIPQWTLELIDEFAKDKNTFYTKYFEDKKNIEKKKENIEKEKENIEKEEENIEKQEENESEKIIIHLEENIKTYILNNKETFFQEVQDKDKYEIRLIWKYLPNEPTYKGEILKLENLNLGCDKINNEEITLFIKDIKEYIIDETRWNTIKKRLPFDDQNGNNTGNRIFAATQKALNKSINPAKTSYNDYQIYQKRISLIDKIKQEYEKFNNNKGDQAIKNIVPYENSEKVRKLYQDFFNRDKIDIEIYKTKALDELFDITKKINKEYEKVPKENDDKINKE